MNGKAHWRLRSEALLAEISLDVFLGLLLFGLIEDLFGLAELDQISGPGAIRGIDILETCFIGHSLGLRQIVSHDGDREAFLQLSHEILDLPR